MAHSYCKQTTHSMLKPQLKSFLSDRGMTVSDYNISQLRELATKAVELNLPVIKTPDDTQKTREDRTRVIFDGNIIQFPYIFSPILTDWTDDLKNVPSFNEADVFVYLLSTCHWDPDRLSRYKSERGYGLYVSRHVHSLQCHKLTHSHIYIKSKCIRETSQSSDPYNTWILLNEDGKCVSAGCDCTGDDGGCKHVLCLMLAVANWSSRHEDRHTQTCTIL